MPKSLLNLRDKKLNKHTLLQKYLFRLKYATYRPYVSQSSFIRKFYKQIKLICKATGRVCKAIGRVFKATGRVFKATGRVCKAIGRVFKATGRVFKAIGRVFKAIGRTFKYATIFFLKSLYIILTWNKKFIYSSYKYIDLVDISTSKNLHHVENKTYARSKKISFYNPITLNTSYLKKKYVLDGIEERISIVSSATLFGPAIVTSDDYYINYESGANLYNGFVAGISHYATLNKKDNTVADVNFLFSTEEKIEKGVLLTGRCYSNYYHYLIEYIPRLYLIDQHIDNSIPLLVHDDLYPQQYEILNLVNKNNRKIIKIKSDDVLYNVDKLWLVSTHTYHPDSPSIPYWKMAFFCYDHLNYVRSLILSTLSSQLCANVNMRKVYITRKSGLARAIENERQVINIMQQHDIAIVDIEKLSFIEQVSLFYHADVIIVPGGATLANAIFCNRNCTIISLVGYLNREFCSHSNLAKMFRAKFYCMTSEPSSDSELNNFKSGYKRPNLEEDLNILKNIMKSYKINIDKLRVVLKKMIDKNVL